MLPPAPPWNERVAADLEVRFQAAAAAGRAVAGRNAGHMYGPAFARVFDCELYQYEVGKAGRNLTGMRSALRTLEYLAERGEKLLEEALPQRTHWPLPTPAKPKTKAERDKASQREPTPLAALDKRAGIIKELTQETMPKTGYLRAYNSADGHVVEINVRAGERVPDHCDRVNVPGSAGWYEVSYGNAESTANKKRKRGAA